MSISRCRMLPSSLRLTTVWRALTVGKRSTPSLVTVLPWRVILSIEIVSRPSVVRKPYCRTVGGLQENSETTTQRKRQTAVGLMRLINCNRGVLLCMGKIFLVKLPNHFLLFPDKLSRNCFLYLNGLLQGR